MAINYIRKDTGEIVEKEPWCWRAYYTDGSQLDQFEVSQAGAVFHPSADIDGSRVKALQLLHATYPPITVAMPAGATVQHFYRVREQVEEFTDPTTNEVMHRTMRFKLWVLGFKQDGRYWLAYTNEQGQTIFSGDDKLFTLTNAMPEGA